MHPFGLVRRAALVYAARLLFRATGERLRGWLARRPLTQLLALGMAVLWVASVPIARAGAPVLGRDVAHFARSALVALMAWSVIRAATWSRRRR